MKRSLVICWLAALCLLSAGCGARNDEGGNAPGKTGGANDNAPVAASPVKADVAFARDAVEGLFGGDTTAAVAGAFDWENLKVPGADVGGAYRELPDEENREEFQKGFIEKFSRSFKASGASVGDLKNWRELSREGERTVVAVDTKTGKTMRVFVVRRDDGRQLISELAIE